MKNGPQIVTSGLVLSLDAADKLSYSGTGTSWIDSAGNLAFTLTNGPTFSTDAQGSFVFDGTNDYAQASNVPTAGNMTLSCWFKTSTQQTNKYLAAIPKQVAGGANGLDLLIIDGTVIGSYVANSSTFNYTSHAPSGGYADGRWHNVVSTHDGSNPRLYYDGVLVNTVSLSGDIAVDATKTMAVGTFPNFSNYATATITQVYLYNRAITAADVLQNFNAMRGRFGV